MSGKGTTTVQRPETPPRSSDRGRSRLGDVTRPVHIDRRINRRGRSTTILLAIVVIAIAGALAAALFVLPVQTYFGQDERLEQRSEQLVQLEAVNADLRTEVERLRTEPGTVGLVQGNGGHVSKHALATYSTAPPDRPHRILTATHDTPDRLAADPARSGTAILDGVTVDFDRDQPGRAIGIIRFDDGSRTWATSDDESVMHACMTEECVGRQVGVDTGVVSL